MRELKTLESKSVSGGIVGELIAAAIIADALTYDPYYDSYYDPFYSPYYSSYSPYSKVTEYATPVYDNWGRYQGDMVDTYTTTYW